MSRFLKSFIAVSVLLNLLLAGMVIGHLGRYIMGPHMHHAWKDMAQALPADEREHFENAIERAEQDTGDLRKQMNEAHKKAAGLLKAEPFDKKAYLAQMQQIQQLHDKIMQRMTGAVAELAEQSSPEERTALADMLRHPPHPPGEE